MDLTESRVERMMLSVGSNRLRITDCRPQTDRRRLQAHHSELGFNLLELVMVVLIISLALGISYPALSRGTATFHLRSTGRDILNTLRYAREKAITEQGNMKVTVDPQNQKVILSDEVGNNGRVYTLPHDVKIGQVFMEGQEVKEGPLVIHFVTNGSSENAEIHLVSSKGGVIKVVTDPITGGARIQTPQGENVP